MKTYELKKIKQAGGEETPRFEAQIFADGKKIGIVYNEGCGGCCFYRFDKQEEGKLFDEFIADWAVKNNEDFEPNDMWVYARMDDEEEKRKLKRWSKTKTPFRLKGMEKGAWRVLGSPYSPMVREFLIKKYGDEIETIYTGEMAA